MSTEVNEQIVRRFLEGSLADPAEVFADDVVWHGPSPFGTVSGLSNLKNQVASSMFGAFPDLRTTIEALDSFGDDVVVRWMDEGSHSGDFLGFPPAGNRISYTGISIYRVVNGMIVEAWVQWDMWALLEQIKASQPRKSAE